MVIRTQKDRKLQTLIEVCTDFSSLVSPTHLHRPAEQSFAVHQQAESYAEEVEYQEDVFAVGDRPPWNRRSPDTSVSPSLQQMFVLAHRMGYEMRPIAGQPDAQRRPPGNRPSLTRIVDSVLLHEPAGITRELSASAAESLAICSSPLKLLVDRTSLPTGLYQLHSAPPICQPTFTQRHQQSRKLLVRYQSQDIDIIPIHPQSNTCTETCASFTDRQDGEPQEVLSPDTEEHRSSADTDQDAARSYTTIRPVGKSVDWSVAVDNQQTDEDVMQISGAGHWFLEGWIGDHAVDFLVDSGSAVTAVSRSFFNTLSEAGAPVGVLRPTARRLRGANGSQIDISGCSSCVVSFLGLRTEFPILVCDLSTDAIIGTDTLGSILPHTLDIKNGLLFTEGGVSLQLHRRDAALSGRVFTVGHCSIPPHSEAVLHCTTRTVGGRSLPPSGLLEGLTVFSENTGLVVGRTLVDPSGWKVPVLVSNFGQETVMVEPFSEIGMIAQVSAIQPTMNRRRHPSCDPVTLPEHLQGLLKRTSGDLDSVQKSQLASTLLEFVDLFPIPGSALSGHTDAVEHTIDTGDSQPVQCAPRRMSPPED